MKSTGVVRKIDPLGRIVLPVELRRTLGIMEADPMEIFVDEEYIMLRKYVGQACSFCGNMDDTIDFKGKRICKKCINEMQGKLS